MEAQRDPRVVLVHDWLTGMRGGEKCLEVVCRRWPQSRLFTLLHVRGKVSDAIEHLRPQASFLQLLPWSHRYYRWLLPLMPAAAAAWRLPPCDLVVSFSHCVAKSARVPRGVPHVCYCFTPMRYAWHMRQAYFGDPSASPQPGGQQRFLGSLKARAIEQVLGWLREWDRRTAAGVTHFVAISQTVRRRIAECYGRDSVIIYPPVDTDLYSPAAVPREDFYLVVSAFAPYKRIDLAIEACNRLRRHLVIIGTGQDDARLRSLAGPTVHLVGWQPDTVIRDHLRRCRALLFPGEEDFGIVPLEANACGTPVIALGRGGATETVIPPGSSKEPTGLWFAEPTADALTAALQLFERRAGDFHPAAARRQAQRFNARRFEDELFGYFAQVLSPPKAPVRRAA
jgi:glycosyltransferase involved in cell wall biosynthesis